MAKFEALLEDEDNIFGGTPKSKYWDFHNQVSKDLAEDEFDNIVEKIAVMEAILAESNGIENIDNMIRTYVLENSAEVEHMKKNVYMELASSLLERVND
ncbi:DUF2018 family protein [Sulfurimonas lithotrophica]|uniref:DUF2018 family protein n=1 Tax=Sulfurimonas lithotrophica TaxID=2590022 RepID=A0A5P8P1N3_9BACT|nr:DUF2018 family protein [Sulfurimonas lithotrophica]QFR49497.1 DUF2018 family protein [Sulfurimonas lithotrophica]